MLIELVADTSTTITKLLNGMTQQAPVHPQFNEEQINERVKQVVSEKMSETNKLIESQAAMIRDINEMLRSKGGE